MKLFTDNLQIKDLSSVEEITAKISFNGFEKDKLIFLSGKDRGAVFFDDLNSVSSLALIGGANNRKLFLDDVLNSLRLRYERKALRIVTFDLTKDIRDINSAKEFLKRETEFRCKILTENNVKSISLFNQGKEKFDKIVISLSFFTSDLRVVKELLSSDYLPYGIHFIFDVTVDEECFDIDFFKACSMLGIFCERTKNLFSVLEEAEFMTGEFLFRDPVSKSFEKRMI